MSTTHLTPTPAAAALVPSSRAWAVAIGAFLIAHGGAHVVGALEMWGLRHDDATLAMDTAISYTGAGAALMGVAWCLGLAAMVLAGVLVGLRHPWATRAVAGAVGLSLIVCLAGLPTAFIGVAIDVVILVVLAVARARRTR